MSPGPEGLRAKRSALLDFHDDILLIMQVNRSGVSGILVGFAFILFFFFGRS